MAQSWENVIDSNSINLYVENFIKTINNLPKNKTKHLQSNAKYFNIKHWITHVLIVSLCKHDKLRKQLRQGTF